MSADPVSEIDPGAALSEWVVEVTDAVTIRMERRSAGGSRAGYAVEVDKPDGTTDLLWLRCDTGAGPQSNGHYTVRRESSVYREVFRHGLRVAEVVAVHPTADAFLMKRLPGRNWFSEVHDPADQLRIAQEFIQELATLHRIDTRQLDLPELGPLGSLADHILAELAIWEAQFRRYDEPEPVIELAFAWLRRELGRVGDGPVVLNQGDTGPGNFMFDGGHLVAITDWELAHFGDPLDDIGWIYAHDLQERFPDLPERIADYARYSGREIDPVRIRYFLVLAQTRCAIGTRSGLLARDSRGEIGAHLIYSTLHQRALADALALAVGVDIDAADPEPLPDPGDSARTWMYDVVLEDLRGLIVPAITDDFAARRAKSMARLVKCLREQDRIGDLVERADATDLAEVLGVDLGSIADPRRELCRRIAAHEIDDTAVVRYTVRDWARRTQLVRPAMGVLADRRYSPLP